MLFNSIAFLIFLPIVILLYWVLPHKFRWVALLIASYYFYMSWNVNLVILIGATTIISYLSGIFIEKTDSKKLKKMWMLISVISSLLILFFYKYFNFFSASTVAFFRLCGVPMSDFSLKVMLPVGISFYTFQTLSYSIDVYRGNIKAERHFGYYALFVSFFPQLVAGPIERPENLIPQLRAPHKFDSAQATVGFQYILVGFFKKVVVADTIAVMVNSVYNNASGANGLTVIIATLLFALQILCDFDGYTNIAIGVAKIMGINLVKNFNNPYTATSIKDFWGRWHISLSTWFRDYVYIPLGGNRCSKPRHLFNLFITFFLSGLWHGANWTFIIWGTLHGVYQIIGNLLAKPKKTLYAKMNIKEDSSALRLGKQVTTFILVCFAWIFFRANSVGDAFMLIGKIFTDWNFTLGFISTSFANMGITALKLVMIFAMIACLVQMSRLFVDRVEVMTLERDSFSKCVVRKVLYITLVMVVMLGWIYTVSQLGYENGFIYFQF